MKKKEISPDCKIRRLEEVFERKGVRYEQVERNGDYVIYRCIDKEMVRPYYELFVYKLGNPHPMDRGDWDMIELYPSDNAFGVWAWCCSSMESLRRMLEEHFGEYSAS